MFEGNAGGRRARAPIVWLWLAAALLGGCPLDAKRVLTVPDAVEHLDRDSAYLKAHLKDGRLLLFSKWDVDVARREVVGEATQFDVDRRVTGEGWVRLSLNDVALFETNRVDSTGLIIPLAIMTGVTAAVTGFCIAQPKSCFGSCPTFYLTDGEKETLQAEGFSRSVAPSLEATDIDALYRAKPSGQTVKLRMTNEALETHVVKAVRLWAAPRPAGGRVFATSEGELWEGTTPVPPAACQAPEGDCTAALAAFDGEERQSLTDADNLLHQEVLDLRFDAPPAGNLGVVVAARQTFLSTFLLYQELAYMGRNVSEWFSVLEDKARHGKQLHSRVEETLGGVEVWVETPTGFVRAGDMHETGPLATDLQLIPLAGAAAAATGPGPLHVQLRLNQGNWRVDFVGLTALGANVQPLRLEASDIRRAQTGNAGDGASLAPPSLEHPMVTLPGDAVAFTFDLPGPAPQYELFLESRGYYFEWMRNEWLADQDQSLALQMMIDPKAALKRLAPAFKKVEPNIEAMFWGSRYARP